MTSGIILAIAALATAILGAGGWASVQVARINARANMGEHFDRELRRMSERNVHAQARMDHIETRNVELNDHIDILENHIWRQLPPPPPPRPRYTPFHSPNPQEQSE